MRGCSPPSARFLVTRLRKELFARRTICAVRRWAGALSEGSDEDATSFTRAREQAGFRWHVPEARALREVTGIPIREFNLGAEAHQVAGPCCASCSARSAFRASPAVSYGHVNALGSELLFPEGGEVAHTHISSLGRNRRCESHCATGPGVAPFFLEFRERLREHSSASHLASFGSEGPITTAYELRGEEFFMEVLDSPSLAGEFLGAVVESTLEFHRWVCALDGRNPVNPNAGGMCDDLASFIPARLFREMVLPFWEQYYRGTTTGRRHAHVEDLRAEQLPFLEEIGLSFFDPSISPKLTPGSCATTAASRSPGGSAPSLPRNGLPGSRRFRLSGGRRWRERVHTISPRRCARPRSSKKCARSSAPPRDRAPLSEGATREEIGALVSPAGREKLWDGWCGYLGPKSSRGGRSDGIGHR